jgi:hypothetical protein
MDAEPMANNGDAGQDGVSVFCEVLAGAIDIHVHAAPDVFPRKFDDVELAMIARDAGYRGLLLKCHHFPTMGRAFHIRRQFPEFAFYGGLVLNSPTGGLNPSAVKQALEMEAKEIWFPTLSAAHHRRQQGLGEPGITIVDSRGRVRPAVNEIVKAIAKADSILGTGHLSEAEISVLVDRALDAGVRKIVVTHPEWPPIAVSLDLQARFAETGRVFFERCYIVTLPGGGGVKLHQIAEAIRTVGWQSTVLATDLGQATNPCPVKGMHTYVRRLAAHGFTKAQLRHMVVTNPTRLLGLTLAIPERATEEVRASV